jgi:VanZ family protein
MMTTKFLLRLPAILFALLIFILSQLPAEMVPPNVFDWQDKLLHFLVYSLFGTTLIIATAQSKNTMRRIILVILIGAAYALLDEIHQLFVPGRVCDILDWLADSLGIAFSLLFLNKVTTIVENFIKNRTK